MQVELKPSKGPTYGEVWIKGRDFTNDGKNENESLYVRTVLVRVFFGRLEATILESNPNLIVVEAPRLPQQQVDNVTVPVTILEETKREVKSGLMYTYQQSPNICVM
jgi:hypothetical protein